MSGPGSPSAAAEKFGTVTGRPRHVGGFNPPVPLRYAVAVNSVSSIMLNKLDILSGVNQSACAVAYETRRAMLGRGLTL